MCELSDSSETAIALTGCNIRFILKNKLTGEVVVDEEASILDEDEGTVAYAWQEGDTDATGVYNAEWEVEFPSGEFQTFPNSRHIQVKIFTDLGGLVPH